RSSPRATSASGASVAGFTVAKYRPRPPRGSTNRPLMKCPYRGAISTLVVSGAGAYAHAEPNSSAGRGVGRSFPACGSCVAAGWPMGLGRRRAGGRYGAGHPAANAAWKQMTSLMFRTGAEVDPAQLAYGSPAANAAWKQTKSLMFRTGAEVLPSQLA